MNPTPTGARILPELSRRRRWACLIMLSASLLVITLDMTILNIALPKLAADLRPTADQQLWIVDVYSLVLAGLLVPMSALADRWGRKRMLLAGFAVFGAVSLLVLLAHAPATVIAVRALLGAGGAMIMPTTLSMIRVVFTDPRERATALGVWAASSSLGAVAGPIVGGVLLQSFSWQAAFLVNVPVMMVALVAGAILLPESRVPVPGRWDVLATVLSITGMVALMWAIKHLATDGPADPASWAAFAFAAGALSWFVLRCLRRPFPLLDVRLLGRAPFTAGILAALASMFALGALLLLVTQWLQLVRGMSPLEAGLVLMPSALSAAMASMVAPALAARVGPRVVIAGGLAAGGAGFLLLYAASGALSSPLMLATLTLVGLGGGALTIGSAIIMSSTPQAKAGNAAVIEETAYDLGGVLGVAILGSVAAAIYRADLTRRHLTGRGLTSDQADTVIESLGGAMETAARLGDRELTAWAQNAFNDSLAQIGLYGGLLMTATTVAVFALIPKSYDLSRQQH